MKIIHHRTMSAASKQPEKGWNKSHLRYKMPNPSYSSYMVRRETFLNAIAVHLRITFQPNASTHEHSTAVIHSTASLTSNSAHNRECSQGFPIALSKLERLTSTSIEMGHPATSCIQHPLGKAGQLLQNEHHT